MSSDEEKADRINSYRNIFKFIWHCIKDYKLLIFISSILFIISVILNTILPLYLGNMIDELIYQTQHEQNFALPIKYFIIIVALKFLSPAFSKLADILCDYIGTRVLSNTINKLVEKTQKFSMEWHINSFAGSTARKITRGSWAVTDSFSITTAVFLPALLIIISTTSLLYWKLPEIVWLFIATILIYLTFSLFISVKYVRPKFKDFISEDTKLSGLLNDVITSIHTVKSFATEHEENAKINTQAKIMSAKAWYAFWFANSMNIIRHSLEVLVYAAILYYCLLMWQNNKATTGDIVLVTTIATIVISYLNNIGNMFAYLQRHLSDAEEAAELMSQAEDIKDVINAQKLNISNNPDKPLIEFKNVAFRYPKSQKNLFENLSVEIFNGEKIALVGASGSGKSSFVKLIQRFYNATGGAIFINGQNIAEVTQQSLRENISLVPQDPILFHRTLKENISYGKSSATMEEIIAAAKQAHIHDFIASLKDGYETKVGERGIKLSGGERQRVAIARAILANRPILILDEATSSLDSISEFAVRDAINKLLQNRTSITIAHRLSTIKNADRILVFENGKIIEQGNHERLIATPNSRYKELYEMQYLGALK